MIYNILIQRVHFLAKFVFFFLHVIFFILIILSLFTYP